MASKSLKRKLDDITPTEKSEDSAEPLLKKQKVNLGSNEQENSPKNNEYNQNIAEQVELPPEILISIFCQLSRADLARAGGVCQHWWLVSKDESLSWCPIKSFKFTEDGRAYAQYRKCLDLVCAEQISNFYLDNEIAKDYTSYEVARKSLYANKGSPVKVKELECNNGVFFLVVRSIFVCATN